MSHKHHSNNRLRFCMPLAGEFAYSRLITGSVVGRDPARREDRIAGLLDLGIHRDRIHTTQGVYLPEAHNQMVETLLKYRDWDGIGWLEHDHNFDWDLVGRMESYTQPMVGIRYYTRDANDPRMMVAHWVNKDDPFAADPPCSIQTLRPSEVVKLLRAPGIYPIDFVPHGMTYVSRKVYETIPPPWYIAGDHKELGDDVYFCANLKRHGFQAYVDTVPYSAHFSVVPIDDWWYMKELRRRWLELNFGRLCPPDLGGDQIRRWLPTGLVEITEELNASNRAQSDDGKAGSVISGPGTL